MHIYYNTKPLHGDSDGIKADANDIEKVLTMFTTYVTPLTNIPYEICVFNSRQQKSNETFLQYVTEIKRLGDKCELT